MSSEPHRDSVESLERAPHGSTASSKQWHTARIAHVLAIAALCCGSLPWCGVQAAAEDSAYVAGTPFTYLFDTGSRSPRPLSAKALAAKKGWSLVPEDETEHDFQGDVVFLNDKLVAVLRREGPGAEVYSATPGGPRLRAVVMSAPKTAVAIAGMSKVRIEENGPAAVMVEADFRGDGQSGTCTAGFRLTTGQSMLEMTGGQAADRFFAWSNTRYVVVPDFFADDMVFSATTCDLPRFGLPTENFLLSLIEGGDAMLMCVWRSAGQQAYAVATGEGAEREIRGCEIEGGKDKTLWLAVMEQPGIWHRDVQTEKRDAPTLGAPADWKPPFDAAWRVDVCPDPPATSKVVYPLDRSPATPLTVLCPIDVLRNTLGVGPCQYILQTEGLAAGTNPTPNEVMSWVEKQFSAKKGAESADEIRKRLDAMVEHVRRAQARIDEYAALAGELRAICRDEKNNEDVQHAVQTFTGILDDVDRTIASCREGAEPCARAAELAGQVAAIVGHDDALAKCGPAASELRRIGAVQDRTLSKCRMAVRWLRQQARMTAIRDPRAAGLAGKIRARVGRFIEGQ